MIPTENNIVAGALSLPLPILAAANQPGSSKAGDIAYEIFGMIPVTGTFIGIHHMYKAITSGDNANGWEIAKIITQISSILLVPQVILGIAHGIKALVDCCRDDAIALPPPNNPVDGNGLPLPIGNVAKLYPVGKDGLPLPTGAKDANGLPFPTNYVAK